MHAFLIFAMLITAAAPGAVSQVSVQDMEREMNLYRSLVESDPLNARYLNALGFSYYRLNRLDEAMAAYRKACQADPKYAVPFNNIGVIHLHRRAYGDAEEAFRKACDLDREYAKAAYNLAIALYRQNKYLDAYRAYQKAKQSDATYVKKRIQEPGAKEKLNQESVGNAEQAEILQRLAREADAEP
jgi:tetratricopeptide (TPR) repeat protein